MAAKEACKGETKRVKFEHANPILRVERMDAAVKYYRDVLGFENAPWGDGQFTCVTRDGATIYLCRGAQGNPGAWVWVGVDDAEELFEEFRARGAKIVHGPRNYPWAMEIRVEDVDGNVLRFGSDAKSDRPYDPWV